MPAQIAAIRAAVEAGREPRVPLLAVEREVAVVEAARSGPAEQTLLQRKLEAGEWVVSVELDPPKGTNMQAMLSVATRLKASGAVDEVDINDNPMARARLSALIAAAAIERTVGLETIPHVTPRDASIMGLQSQLLGAHAEGVRNVLAVTGDPPHVGDYPGSSGVYDFDSIGLTALLGRLNEGEDYSGKAIDAPTSFYVGVAVNPSADDLDTELDRFRQKLDAGARFAMTQALFDIAYLDRFLEHFGGESPIPFLVGIWPVRSFQLAFRLHNEVPGITVPDAGAETARGRRPGRREGGARARPRAPRGLARAGGRDLRHPALQGAGGRARPPAVTVALHVGDRRRPRRLPRRGVGATRRRRARSLRAALARGVPVRTLVADHPAQARGLSARRSQASTRMRSRAFGETDVERLLGEAAIVRNRAKIEATIANARAIVDLRGGEQPFAELVWSFAPPPQPPVATLGELPAATPESKALAKALKARGFRFVGPTTAYALMEACGLVNDHLAELLRPRRGRRRAGGGPAKPRTRRCLTRHGRAKSRHVSARHTRGFPA